MRNRLLSSGAALLLLPAALSGSSIEFAQTNLVSDGAVPAAFTDPDLKNPWGISFGPTTPFWVSDNGTGLSTLYDGAGMKQGLVLTIPPAPGSPAGTLATPTGTVFNDTTANFTGDRFLFATEDGTIAGWQGSLGTTAAVRVDSSASGAVYKGLTIGGSRLYATDFAGGKIDVFDSAYSPLSLGAGAFLDPNLPSGYAPFNIQTLDGALYVTYALKQTGGDDDVPGPGFGFVDKFDLDGNLVRRLVVGVPGDPKSPLNSPWGLAIAPAGFGDLGGLLLVGNFGDGRINAFDPATGTFVTGMSGTGGAPLVIDGLWGLEFGNGGPGFDPNKLYFTAGLNQEADGLFGSLAPTEIPSTVPEPADALLIGAGLAAVVALRRSLR
jgi:uncharacterized protein (TIGR03118 family)